LTQLGLFLKGKYKVNFVRNTEYPTHHQLLKQELECFSLLEDQTREFINKTSPYEIESVIKFLDERNHWIETLKSLELKRGKTEENVEKEQIYLRKKIAKIAGNLVAIDSRIIDILKEKKMGIIKEMIKVSENYNRNKKSNRSFRREKHKIVDIHQE